MPVTFGDIAATLKDGQLSVNFTTLSETNNHHFIIEASADGNSFQEIGSIKSLAPGGNSNNALDYQFTIAAAGVLASFALLTALLAATPLTMRARCRVWSIILVAVFFACSRNENAISNNKTTLFLRIAQVDVDGKRSYSKVVKVEMKD